MFHLRKDKIYVNLTVPRGDLAEDPIEIAVPYSGHSGNIAFELPRIDAPFVNLNFPV